MPEHWLHVYEKPLAGTAFIRRLQASGYSHRLTAQGGSDKASCTLALGRSDAEAFLGTYLANRIAIYVDNPAVPIFDGFISRLTLNAGALTFTRSIDAMYNRAAVTYSAPGVSATALQRTAVADNAASQAVYGIKQGEVDGQYLRGTVVTRQSALRDTLARLRAWPQNSTTFNSQGGDNYVLQVEMLGWYHVLDWASYGTFEVASNITPTDWLEDVVLANYPNTDFFDTTDTSAIDMNAAWTIRQQENGQKTFWQLVQSAVEPGDGATQWVAGLTDTDPNTGTRRLYYRRAGSETRYTVRAEDGRVRDVFGGIVPPWQVRPDARCAVGDVVEPGPDKYELSDVSASATATALSFFGAATVPANLNDNDLATNWASTAADVQWIQYTFTTAVLARAFTLTNTTGTPDRAPRAFTLSGSNTGAFAGEQTLLLTVAESGAYWDTVSQETKTYELGNTSGYLYYRITMTDKQGAFGQAAEYSIAEWRLFDGTRSETRASFYIESVDYDSESQAVQLTSADDISSDGAFQFGRYYKAYGERFGQPPRFSDTP